MDSWLPRFEAGAEAWTAGQVRKEILGMRLAETTFEGSLVAKGGHQKDRTTLSEPEMKNEEKTRNKMRGSEFLSSSFLTIILLHCRARK